MSTADLDKNANEAFPGFIVRKDLSKLVKGNALVPTYVLEYLLGQYCATDDESVIETGVERVQQILHDHYVIRNQATLVRSQIKEKGSHRVIDRITVDLNDKIDQYEATFMNLGLKAVPIDDDYVRKHPKLLVGGVWSIVDVEYQHHEDSRVGPWSVESLKPIQVSSFDFDTYLEGRQGFSVAEWIDLLVQSMGYNPEFFGDREKLLLLTRLIPYCENNYNLIELGPKGTGKSHIFSEFSPHGILISGGEVTLAKLFVNNSNGNLGLVGYWDTIAFDEFAGQTKRSDKSLVDVMKNYLANKSFSRGMDTQSAPASFAFVGNTRRSVPYMLKHTDLFEELPAAYHDSAFIDRLHFYLPGWEVSVLRNELLTDGYGFIVDYFAEMLKHLRTADYAEDYRRYFELDRGVSARDRTAIEKTTSGLLKILFPGHDATKEDIEAILRFAVEGRKRVYNQLIRIDETFEQRRFVYTDSDSSELRAVSTLEERTYPQLTRREAGEGVGPSGDDATAAAEGAALPESAAGADSTRAAGASGASVASITPGSQRVIAENETGLSYHGLFAECLRGAGEIELVDPYIRNFHQVKNVFEFLEMVMQLQEVGDEVAVTLQTAGNEYETDQSNLLEQVRDSFAGTSVNFAYTISDEKSLHARYITTDTGWKITLDRGLDIFQPFNRRDAFNLQNTVQEARRCRAFEVTYLRSTGN
ncbi:MAG: BREX system Lon protease-like protein BrxL [Spirochaeta sp.]|jgi:ATP-dependent Lon protease|nr:BREX system Lon protease-like protein BrxL [Spirochaeta sp.]